MTNIGAHLLSKLYQQTSETHLQADQILYIKEQLELRFSEFLVLSIVPLFVTEDPYPDYASMLSDVVGNQTLRIFSGGTHPPYLTKEENLKARAIHDLSHILCGADFTLEGEYKVWLHECAAEDHPLWYKAFMFSEIVLQAAVTTHTGNFPDQKVVLLPTIVEALLS